MKTGDYVTNEDGTRQGRVLEIRDKELVLGVIDKKENNSPAIGKLIQSGVIFNSWAKDTGYKFALYLVDKAEFRPMEVPS